MNVMKYIGIFMLFIAAGFYGLILLSPSEITFQVNDDVSAPIQSAFQALHEPQALPNWMHGLDIAKQTKGDGVSIESEYDLFYPKEMVMHRVITVCDTFARLALVGDVPDFFSRTDDYTLEVLDSNHTRISVMVKMKALSMGSRMMLRTEETHKINTANNLSALKKYIEN